MPSQSIKSIWCGVVSAGSAALVGLLLLSSRAHAEEGAPAKAQTLLPVTVELGDVSLTKLPFIMAADNGIFEKNGLKVDLFINRYAANAIRASGVDVPAHNIRDPNGPPSDFSITGGAFNVINMTTIADTPARLIIATMDTQSHYHILARKDITSVDQIKGKRIGYTVPGAITELQLLLYLHHRGWDPKRDVSMFMGGGGVKAIEKGQVDVIVGSEIAQEEGKRVGLNDLHDLGQYRWPMPGSSILALKSWLPANRDATMRFVKATLEAVALAKSDREAAYASLRKWFGIKDPVKLAAVYARVGEFPDKPYPAVEGIELMRKVYHHRALATAKTEDFVDTSFVTELDKSGFIDSLAKKGAH